jgi:uncharacterized protein YigE (DUF2233 family)
LKDGRLGKEKDGIGMSRDGSVMFNVMPGMSISNEGSFGNLKDGKLGKEKDGIGMSRNGSAKLNPHLLMRWAPR